MQKRKVRPLGQITQDMEPLLEEMVDLHELQTHEIISLIIAWIECHRPGAVEEYEDGTKPKLTYGP